MRAIKCYSVVFGVTLKLLVINISPSFPAINKHRRFFYQRSVTTCGTVVRRRRIDNTSPVAALRPVYSDTTQLNSASSRVELRRYKRAFKSTHWGQILAQNRDFCLPHLHLMPPLGEGGGFRWNIAMPFSTGKIELYGYPTVKKIWCCVYSFWQNSRTWQTNRHTDRHRMTT